MATMVADDAERTLIARCRQGDQEAFRLLLERHHQTVYRVAYAITGDPTDAAEIVHETFIKAWRSLGSFRHDATLATWLTRVALNTARDHLRRQRTREIVGAVHGLIRPQPAPDARAAIEDRDELQRAMRRLSPRARQVIALRFGLELSQREIADLLGCPEGTVKSRLNAALTALRKHLDEGRAAT
jgi:RNA polymerase sigma-70 factor, ECF subfamily